MLLTATGMARCLLMAFQIFPKMAVKTLSRLAFRR